MCEYMGEDPVEVSFGDGEIINDEVGMLDFRHAVK